MSCFTFDELGHQKKVSFHAGAVCSFASKSFSMINRCKVVIKIVSHFLMFWAINKTAKVFTFLGYKWKRLFLF